ncbi:UPF0314 protein R03235 [Pigmentiphaga litoralis]|uniref:DUF2585 family protein n=1 Tax=Pigmentiphaga litoralis TaxID=516702 RepID=UPI00167383CD|nr:DUF2585 family protein [Pigmentiphaga litoralis]GGX35903.1 UPF0314 protein R03235 [Pigmentiphaga litoralis]
MAYPSDQVLTPAKPFGKFLIPFLLAIHVLWLVLVGRSAICPCGVVSLWQTGSDAAQNSQQVADPYSLLHLIFGIALSRGFRWLRPTWRVADLALLAVFSSTVWEVMENTPWVIQLMDNAANAAPDYDGDSILNSLADTGFVMIGFWVARLLPLLASVALAVVLELIVSWMINDGLVLATVRILYNLVR